MGDVGLAITGLVQASPDVSWYDATDTLRNQVSLHVDLHYLQRKYIVKVDSGRQFIGGIGGFKGAHAAHAP